MIMLILIRWWVEQCWRSVVSTGMVTSADSVDKSSKLSKNSLSTSCLSTRTGHPSVEKGSRNHWHVSTRVPHSVCRRQKFCNEAREEKLRRYVRRWRRGEVRTEPGEVSMWSNHIYSHFYTTMHSSNQWSTIYETNVEYVNKSNLVFSESEILKDRREIRSNDTVGVGVFSPRLYY